MVEAKLQRFIDVGGGSDSLLQHIKRFVADHGVDAAGDESRRLLHHDNIFSHALTHFDAGGESLVVGFESAHDLEQLHLVHGIKEVRAQASPGAIGDASNLSDVE